VAAPAAAAAALAGPTSSFSSTLPACRYIRRCGQCSNTVVWLLQQLLLRWQGPPHVSAAHCWPADTETSRRSSKRLWPVCSGCCCTGRANLQLQQHVASLQIRTHHSDGVQGRSH
jgi:hypothetical protein